MSQRAPDRDLARVNQLWPRAFKREAKQLAVSVDMSLTELTLRAVRAYIGQARDGHPPPDGPAPAAGTPRA